MFGLSFGELVVLSIVAIVVVGPKNLPTLMRTLGEWTGRLRRMATDIRAESGIDEMLELDGLRSELHNFRRLANGDLRALDAGSTRKADKQPDREREYPRMGVDSYDAVSEDDAPYLAPEPAEAPRAHEAREEDDAARFASADDASAPIPAAKPTALLTGEPASDRGK